MSRARCLSPRAPLVPRMSPQRKEAAISVNSGSLLLSWNAKYRIPFAYLYLPDTPQKSKRLDKVDYRTFGNWGIEEMSRELRWFLRDIEERRDTMIELYQETELEPLSFTLNLSLDSTEETLAIQLRKILSLNDDNQIKFLPQNSFAGFGGTVDKIKIRY